MNSLRSKAKMPKYSLKELENFSVLPDDCNEDAEKFARQYLNPALLVTMAKFRKKEITEGYGEATLLKNGSPQVIFTFTAGICKHASPIVWIDKDNVAKGSIKFY